MISVGKNRYKVLVTITALASILIVNATTIGTGGHIALAHHHDNINVFENSHINVQTDTNEMQDCKTAGGTSPISDSCTASSSNTITQGTLPAPPSPCTTTSHPTVLTLNLSPTTVIGGGMVTLTGTLTDTCTGLGIPGFLATITFTGTAFENRGLIAVTGPTGTYSASFPAPPGPGTYTVQAHFAGAGIFGPSNSGTQTFTVV
jgi:hypothetical protein